jgi:uncharacterized protein (DUF952 family)
MLNPMQNTFSHILGTSIEKNPNTVIIEAKQQLTKHAISFSSVSFSGNDVSIQLSDGSQVLLAADKNISQQIDSLQVTIDNLTIEDKRILRVDMRFARPVVTFQ